MHTDSRLRILHLLSQRPDSTGSGIYIQAMLREARKKGHRNYLVAGIQQDRLPHLDCIEDRHCSFLHFGKHIRHAIVGMSDVMPYESNRFRDLSPIQLTQYEEAFGLSIKDAAERFKPDVVHSHHLWLVTSTARGLLPHVPMVTSCHGSDLRQFQNCPHLREKLVEPCRRLNAVLALSQTQKQTIVDLYGIDAHRIHVVGAGYNDSCFFKASKAAAPPVNMVYAGKLSRAKGVPWMLRALARLSTRDWHLDLVGGGSGEEKEECLALADALGEAVTVHGMVDQVRLAELMKKAHLFVLPSFFEGLPLVVLEALACGCRLVTTRLPGVDEILGDLQTDFIELVDPPRLVDVDKPVEADEKLFENDLTDALERQTEAAIDRAEIDLSPLADRMAAFSWRGVFEKIESVYKTVVG